jgi:hypothetical protein
MKKIFLIILTILLFVGIYLLWNYDPYTNVKYGVSSVESWFSFKNGDVELGEKRKELEEIRLIKSTTCEYIENDSKGKYVFLCNIVYNPIGKTVIPLAGDDNIDVYAIFIPDGNKYSYRVYSSGSEEGIWLLDKDLNYGK